MSNRKTFKQKLRNTLLIGLVGAAALTATIKMDKLPEGFKNIGEGIHNIIDNFGDDAEKITPFDGADSDPETDNDEPQIQYVQMTAEQQAEALDSFINDTIRPLAESDTAPLADADEALHGVYRKIIACEDAIKMVQDDLAKPSDEKRSFVNISEDTVEMLRYMQKGYIGEFMAAGNSDPYTRAARNLNTDTVKVTHDGGQEFADAHTNMTASLEKAAEVTEAMDTTLGNNDLLGPKGDHNRMETAMEKLEAGLLADNFTEKANIFSYSPEVQNAREMVDLARKFISMENSAAGYGHDIGLDNSFN